MGVSNTPSKHHWALHANRRRQILNQYPSISSLFGVDARTQYYAYACIALQCFFAYLARASALRAVLLAITIGPYVDAAILCFLHEATHMLVFRRVAFNRLLAVATNLPLLLPVSEVLRQHHARHHRGLGDTAHDVDVPAEWEIALVGNRPVAKALWLMFNMCILPIRSVCRLPVKLDFFLILNVVSCVLFSTALFLYSRTSFLFMLLSTLNSQGLHPANTRQVQRHVYDGSDDMRTSDDMPTTYSYYGWLNCIMLNVGYHVEHHDFPRVPWTRLPELRRMAGEKWYPSESAYHSRGLAQLINFVVNPNISLADFAH